MHLDTGHADAHVASLADASMADVLAQLAR
jgi:hypothetical protein